MKAKHGSRRYAHITSLIRERLVKLVADWADSVQVNGSVIEESGRA
jgi:hypothetical protein